MFSAECVNNLDVAGKVVSHEVCAENIDNENSVIMSVDTKTTCTGSENVGKRELRFGPSLEMACLAGEC